MSVPDSRFTGTTNLSAVMDEVRASTLATLEEILELRRVIATRDAARLASCAEAMAARFAAGGRLFAFGTGAGVTDAQQVATLFLHPSGPARPLPAVGLADWASTSAGASDEAGSDAALARQLAAFGGKNDIALGLSTSGDAERLVRAFDEASRRGMLTIGLAGRTGGRMAELNSIDYLFVTPSSSVHRIQEAQTTVYHVLWELTVAALRRRRDRRGRAAPD